MKFIAFQDVDSLGKVHLTYALGAALDPDRWHTCIMLCNKSGNWERIRKPALKGQICALCWNEAYAPRSEED